MPNYVQDSNLQKIKNVDVDAGAGNASTGTQRVVIATDQATLPISGTITADSEFPTAAALADAASAAPTTTTAAVIPLLMNATTVDRQRAVVNAQDSVGTGIAAAGIVGQFDDTSTGAVTENQFAPVRISSRRALLVEGVASGTTLPVTEASAAAIKTAVEIIDDWDETDRAKVNLIAGQAGVTGGAGAVAANTQRTTLASDDPAVTALQLIDNAIAGTEMQVDVVAALPAGTNAIGKLAANSGVDIGDVDILSIAAGDNNIGNVDVVTLPNVTLAATTNTIEVVGDAASGAAKAGNPVQVGGVFNTTQPTVTTGQVVELQSTARGAAVVATGADTFNVTVNAALPAGTNGIGKLTANSGVDIGDVDVASVPTDPFGANADAASATGSISAKLRSIAATGIPITGTVTVGSHAVTNAGTFAVQAAGDVAHDAADSGSPVKVGAKAITSLKTTTLVANADRTDNQSDLDGALLVRPQFPLGDLISERVSNTDGASTAFTNFAAVASTRNIITAIHIFNTSATSGYVDFRDGTAGAILYSVYVPTVGGAVLPAGATPYFRTTANTALAFDVSAALTTVYISITGFQSKL